MATIKDKLNIKSTKHTGDDIVVTKEYKRAYRLTKIGEGLVLLAFICLAAVISYIMAMGPIKSTSGYITPKRDKITYGSKVIVTNNKDNMATRLKEAMSTPKELYTAEVVAGPYGVLYGSDGNYTIEGTQSTGKSTEKHIVKSNVKLESKEDKFLDGEYIVRAISGSKEKGQDFLVKSGQIKGLAENSKNIHF